MNRGIRRIRGSETFSAYSAYSAVYLPPELAPNLCGASGVLSLQTFHSDVTGMLSAELSAGASSIRFFIIKITLTDVIITSVQAAGNVTDDFPEETLMLNFGAIEWEYVPQTDTGAPGSPVKAGWDLKANKKV